MLVISALVLLDLSAAFDTVDHHILQQRLEHSYGITGLVRQWFQSYLVGRCQFVRTALSTSSLALILCSVPQGSVLGPILFLLYTADLRLLIEGHFLFPHLYADDTHRLCRPSATLEFQNSICTCIDDVARWMRSNWLQMHTAKTVVLWCTSSRRLYLLPASPIRVDTDQVMPVFVVGNLGIYMDAEVSMRSHVSSCLFCYSASTAEYSSLRSALSSTVTAFVSRSSAVGLR